jgi:hypothetical protein
MNTFAPIRAFPKPRILPNPSAVKPEHSRTPSWPQNALGNCTTWARELTENLLLPFLRAFAASREIPDPGFLDCGGLTPLWISPSTRSIPIPSSVKPEHSRTPSWPQNVFGNCTTWARELTENLLLPLLRAFASSREIPDPGFLDCGGLTPLWISHRSALFPSKAPSSRSTPGHPHFHKTSLATAELGRSPTFRAFASPRETLFPRFKD